MNWSCRFHVAKKGVYDRETVYEKPNEEPELGAPTGADSTVFRVLIREDVAPYRLFGAFNVLIDFSTDHLSVLNAGLCKLAFGIVLFD